MQTIATLLWGTGTSTHLDSRKPAYLEDPKSAYMITLVQEAVKARLDFNTNPSASTAIEYARSCGYTLNNNVDWGNSIDTYPLMVFINDTLGTYMLYSDLIKEWWVIEENGEEKLYHDLDTFVEYYQWGRFRYINLWSSNIFDSRFKVVPLLNAEGLDIGNTCFHQSPDIMVSGTPIFH